MPFWVRDVDSFDGPLSYAVRSSVMNCVLRYAHARAVLDRAAVVMVETGSAPRGVVAREVVRDLLHLYSLGVIHPGRFLLNGLGPVCVVYLGQAMVPVVRALQLQVLQHARVKNSLCFSAGREPHLLGAPLQAHRIRGELVGTACLDLFEKVERALGDRFALIDAGPGIFGFDPAEHKFIVDSFTCLAQVKGSGLEVRSPEGNLFDSELGFFWENGVGRNGHPQSLVEVNQAILAW